MKRPSHIIPAVCLLATGCVLEGEPWESSEGALSSGQTQGELLTRLTFKQTSESARENDTLAYYNHVRVGADGVSGGTIASDLGTLTEFIMKYGFTNPRADVKTFYYNKGDLGLGREMHCVDNNVTGGDGQIACYVKNFAAGDKGSEFTFGLSSNIAFNNMAANNPFATVAMVYRDRMTTTTDKVFFVVYANDGKLSPTSNFAALDRHGIAFANAFEGTAPRNPGSEFGTPGVTFNNHIPSNCISCHGGRLYNATAHSQASSLFLPFDLNQFQFEDRAGRTKVDQLPLFKLQNQMVRKVAALSGSAAGGSLRDQLDSWYHNTLKQTDRTEVFEHEFDPTAVIAGWQGSQAQKDIFRSVIRGTCRSCHVSAVRLKAYRFDTAAEFNSFVLGGSVVTDICSHSMPHALQSQREFWLSKAPALLESYIRTLGTTAATAGDRAFALAEADRLHACGPGNVVTLDPPQIAAVLAPLAD